MFEVVAIVQARMESTRLPGKVALPLAGRTLLGHVLHRVHQSPVIDRVVVATTPSMRGLLPGEWYYCASGPDNDVLSRFRECAAGLAAHYIVRITADCPLIDPELITRCVQHLRMYRLDYCTNTNPPTWPDGLDVEVLRDSALYAMAEAATSPSDREHVTPWIRRQPQRFALGNLAQAPDQSRYRLCIDEPNDLFVMRSIMADLGPDCTWQQAVEWLDYHPEVAVLNQGIRRNEGGE